MKHRIAVFASGSGTNFEAIAKACLEGRIDAEVVLCVVDKPGAKVVGRAARFNVPVFEFNPKEYGSKAAFETVIADLMDEAQVELVCLAGYMRLIGNVLLGRYGGRIINIHPALLPAFKGAHAIRDSFDYGVKVYGVTIHFVDESLDGGKIISQEAVPYSGNDIEELETLIHAAEHRLYPATIASLLGDGKENPGKAVAHQP